MYQIIVREISTGSRHNRNLWEGRAIAEEPCRISALSSADYCLRSREEVDWGRFSFRGNKQEIRRLFEAERLSAKNLEKLSEHKDYTVLFLGRPRLEVLGNRAG